MAERKPISKKMRFEVFKRDKFTCQYCGRTVPDVILHVDHIKPVAKGGKNDIMNLITSCSECNLGKGARELDDDTVVKKQQKQIQELAEKREQLDMMLSWVKGLNQVEDDKSVIVAKKIADVSDYEVNEHGMSEIKKLLKRFTVIEILDAVDIAFDKYYRGDSETWNYAFDKIGGVCYNKRYQGNTYYYNCLKKVCYYEYSDYDDIVLNEIVNRYVKSNDDFNKIKNIIGRSKNWTIFVRNVRGMFENGDIQEHTDDILDRFKSCG